MFLRIFSLSLKQEEHYYRVLLKQNRITKHYQKTISAANQKKITQKKNNNKINPNYYSFRKTFLNNISQLICFLQQFPCQNFISKMTLFYYVFIKNIMPNIYRHFLKSEEKFLLILSGIFCGVSTNNLATLLSSFYHCRTKTVILTRSENKLS